MYSTRPFTMVSRSKLGAIAITRTPLCDSHETVHPRYDLATVFATKSEYLNVAEFAPLDLDVRLSVEPDMYKSWQKVQSMYGNFTTKCTSYYTF